MKKLWVGLVFLFCSITLHAQKTRMGQELPFAKKGVDYPLTIHVYGLHFRTECWQGGCEAVVFTDIVSNGRKLELQCSSGIPSVIPEDPYSKTPLLKIGDFHARVLKNASGMELGDGYELLFSDNRTLRCAVSGMVE